MLNQKRRIFKSVFNSGYPFYDQHTTSKDYYDPLTSQSSGSCAYHVSTTWVLDGSHFLSFRNLEKFLFGKVQPKTTVKVADTSSDEESESSEESDDDQEDSGDEAAEVDVRGKRHLSSEKENKASKKRKPAWHDEDDDGFM